MKLHEDEIFSDAISATSQSMDISDTIIEKDYWVTYALKNIVKNKIVDKLVFKGGTSLSKVYKVIHRFSEDVDLAALGLDKKNGSEKKKAIRDIWEKVSSDLLEIDSPDNTKGSYMRKTRHAYARDTVTGDSTFIPKNILLEINAITTKLEYDLMPIKSIIAEFFENNSKNDLIKRYELDSFKINVLSLRRTFTEKILALARLSFLVDNNKRLNNKIRHFYDIHMLFNIDEIKSFIISKDFFNTVHIIREDDGKNIEFNKQWSNNKISNCPLFVSPDKIWDELKPTYNSKEFNALIFKDKPDESEILNTLILISKLMKEYPE